MSKSNVTSIDQIEKIVEFSKKKLPLAQHELFTVFAEEFFEGVSEEDLAGRELEGLSGAVLSHWQLVYLREPKEQKIKIFNPNLKKDGWQSKNTVIEIIHDDMPFLVDSLQMLLNRLGLVVRLIIHLGGIKVKRDQEGKISEIFPIKSQIAAPIIEAPIYIEINRQTDSKTLNEIETKIASVLADVRAAVLDLTKMQQRVGEVCKYLDNAPLSINPDEAKEAKAFLEWLLANNFTFLAYRNYELVESNHKKVLHLIPNSSLGVLHKESEKQVDRNFADFPDQVQKLFLTKQPLIISKTGTLSTVHRLFYTDSIEIKRFDSNGNLIGCHRFIGLYGSTVYYTSVRQIPWVRAKVSEILNRFGYPRNGYAAKNLLMILESLPRHDLLEGSVDQLYQTALGIYNLHGRHLTKFFVREDAYGRYISCLVYLPRDSFNTELRLKIQDLILEAYHGISSDFSVLFTPTVLARIHFTIRLNPKQFKKVDIAALEQSIIAISHTWQDDLRDKLIAQFGDTDEAIDLFNRYKSAFPAGYRESFSATQAVKDIKKIETLSSRNPLTMCFYNPKEKESAFVPLKLYSHAETIPLSEALPILENLGLKVIQEHAYKISPLQSEPIWVNDFLLTSSISSIVDKNLLPELFYTAFAKTWFGEIENDGFNRLVLSAGVAWREVSFLRALAKYLRQMRFPFSQPYLETTLVANAKISKLLIDLFQQKFDPKKYIKNNINKIKEIENDLKVLFEKVTSLDEDRILRQFFALINAMIRTNYYQMKPCISFKFNCREIPELPLPRPLFEIFVYSPRFEGIHLRMAKVARGGLRWSDRREDFRTEILGLVKAQQVKNVVIVPSGAKGGFVLKKLPQGATREVTMEEGITCYKSFISSLLDITDNIVGGKIVPPKDTIRYDEDDPYLVVAADKGTAKFSNYANSISKEYNFWLRDAFASGGQTGYDHKAIGITARGAWESVKYNFSELGINTQTTDFTVIGIGDMLGDVFGNGMLLSQHIKMVGAFNHQHIFLDPNPDPKLSFAERVRMFKLMQSTWADYNKKLISVGGGIYERSLKTIPLSREVKKLLEINKDSASPDEVIHAMLKAKVDLLWNGGIGTYVKASNETHADVNDRSNDAVRVNGNELRCKVVGEGGNLGFTQLGRVEYALQGGLIITDFIDNSGGVDCSDHEVNIKILLNGIVDQKKMTEAERNVLLQKMTNEVADLVLYNNYRQARAISLNTAQSFANIDALITLINQWESTGKINRSLEFLPSNKSLEERKVQGIGFTRPEIAILIAYSKLILKAEVLQTNLLDDAYFNKYLGKLFPTLLVKKYAVEMSKHRLRREIIATQLINDLITNLGLVFIQQTKAETGADLSDIIRAYAVASEIFMLPDLVATIDSLESKGNNVSTKVQQQLFAMAQDLIGKAVRWLLLNQKLPLAVTEIVSKYAPAIAEISKNSAKLIHEESSVTKELFDAGVPKNIAERFAHLTALPLALNVVEVALTSKTNLFETAQICFSLAEKLDLFWFIQQIQKCRTSSRASLLAESALIQEIDAKLKLLAHLVLKLCKKIPKKSDAVALWLKEEHKFYQEWQEILTEIRSSNSIDFGVLYIAAKKLSK
ncbi:MAG: NAD-glutamate dehydrogenase [Gammaproteobacteria bacterium]|nr:NAD-glutamate dehydrogenase [Gammaproteobacteria bacterium]